MTGRRIYAVDFDGTLAETDFPKIIKANTSMFLLCKELKKQGNILILWTCRCGKDLDEAVEFCRKYGLEFDYINENVPENVKKWGNDSRKIFADEYIDDCAWSPVRERIWKQRLERARWRSTSYGTYFAIALLILLIFGIWAFYIKSSAAGGAPKTSCKWEYVGDCIYTSCDHILRDGCPYCGYKITLGNEIK